MRFFFAIMLFPIALMGAVTPIDRGAIVTTNTVKLSSTLAPTNGVSNGWSLTTSNGINLWAEASASVDTNSIIGAATNSAKSYTDQTVAASTNLATLAAMGVVTNGRALDQLTVSNYVHVRSTGAPVPLQEWQDTNGSALASVNSAGVFHGSGSGLTGVTASSVAASNVTSGGVLPAGTVAVNSMTNGYFLTTDGTNRYWTNSISPTNLTGSGTIPLAAIPTTLNLSASTAAVNVTNGSAFVAITNGTVNISSTNQSSLTVGQNTDTYSRGRVKLYHDGFPHIANSIGALLLHDSPSQFASYAKFDAGINVTANGITNAGILTVGGSATVTNTVTATNFVLSAPQWIDVPGIVSLPSVSSAPTLVAVTNGSAIQLPAYKWGNETFWVFPMPHSIATTNSSFPLGIATNNWHVEPHLHYSIPSATIDSTHTNVAWQLIWEYGPIGGAYNTRGTNNITNSVSANGTHYYAEFGAITNSGPWGISGNFRCRLSRVQASQDVASGASDYSTILDQFDLHVPVGNVTTIGSRNETSQ